MSLEEIVMGKSFLMLYGKLTLNSKCTFGGVCSKICSRNSRLRLNTAVSLLIKPKFILNSVNYNED